MDSQQIFISYVRENQESVQALSKALADAGYNSWWDKELLSGEAWQLETKKAIEESAAVILCFSAEAEVRPQSVMYQEIRDAIALYRKYKPGTVFLIPIRFSDGKIPSMPIDSTLMLNELHYIDLFPEEQWNQGIEELKGSIDKALSKESTIQQPPNAVHEKSPHTPPKKKNLFAQLALYAAFAATALLIVNWIYPGIFAPSDQKTVYLSEETDTLSQGNDGLFIRSFSFSVNTASKNPIDQINIEIHPRGDDLHIDDFEFTSLDGIMQDAIAMLEPDEALNSSFIRIEVERFSRHQKIEALVRLKSANAIPENALRIAIDSPDEEFVLQQKSSTSTHDWLFTFLTALLLGAAIWQSVKLWLKRPLANSSLRAVALVLGLLWITPSQVFAQRVFQGQVTNRAGEPIEATVEIKQVNDNLNVEVTVASVETHNGTYRIALSNEKSAAVSASQNTSSNVVRFKIEVSRMGYVTKKTFPFTSSRNETKTHNFKLVPFRGSESIVSLPDSLFVPLVELKLNSNNQQVIIDGIKSALGTLRYRFYDKENLTGQHLYLRTPFEYQDATSAMASTDLKVAFLVDAYLSDNPFVVIKYGAAWAQTDEETWHYDLQDELRTFIQHELGTTLLQALDPIRQP